MPGTDASSDDPPLDLHVGDEHLVIRQRYEVASIVNDIAIGLWFVIGSILFFSSSTETAGTWLFLLGSLQMLVRPAIRLGRRVHLQRIAPSRHPDAGYDF